MRTHHRIILSALVCGCLSACETLPFPPTEALNLAVDGPTLTGPISVPTVLSLRATPEPTSDVRYVVFTQNDVTVHTALPPFEYRWYVSWQDNGVNTFRAFGYDAAGNESRSPVISVNVSIPIYGTPIIQRAEVSSYRVLGETFLIQADFSAASPATCELFFDNASIPSTSIPNCTSGTPHEFRPHAVGNSQIRFVVTDASGKKGWVDNLAEIDVLANVSDNWTSQFGTELEDGITDLILLGEGSAVASGFTFGGLASNTNNGGSDAFLRFQDASGGISRTVQFGSAKDDAAQYVDSALDGGLYVAGYTAGTLGQDHFGDLDVFIARFNADGQVEWLEQVGTPGVDLPMAITARQSGGLHILVSVDRDGVGDFAEGTGIYLITFSHDGRILRSDRVFENRVIVPRRIIELADGGLFIVGETRLPLDGVPLSGESDMFIMRVLAGGDVAWVRQYGTDGIDYVHDAVADGTGGVLMGGSTFDVFDEGDGVSHNRGAFVIQTSATGDVVRQEMVRVGEPISPAPNIELSRLTLTSSGDVLVAGRVDWWTLYVQLLDSNLEPVATRYLTPGTYNVVRKSPLISGLAADGLGNIWLAGVSDHMLFGPSSGSKDVFFAKLPSMR